LAAVTVKAKDIFAVLVFTNILMVELPKVPSAPITEVVIAPVLSTHAAGGVHPVVVVLEPA
jgi:hypothetical protein